MRFRVLALALLLAVVFVGTATGEDEVRYTGPEIRLVHVTDGLRSVAPSRDLSKLKESNTYKVAKRAGVDLEEPAHPLLQQSYTNGRLYYVFYKTIENAFGDRPYLIQRIKKTQRTWSTAEATEATEAEETITYQVEVFKTRQGAIKRPDEHHGSYGIRENHRREIVKEYEVGFGEVPGTCEGTDWPFPPKRLFEYLYEYGEDPDVYDSVVFLKSTTWTLAVSFDADGAYRVASPELGFDAPEKMPDPEKAVPPPIERSREVVLEIESARMADLVRQFGLPLQTTTFANRATDIDFEGGVTCYFDEEGELKTLFTRPGFLGKTREGVRHGDARWRVMEVMGVPRRQRTDAKSWRYGAVTFDFDGYHRVSRILTSRR